MGGGMVYRKDETGDEIRYGSSPNVGEDKGDGIH